MPAPPPHPLARVERFANNASTTLSGGIDGSVTSLVVVSSDAFPPNPFPGNGQFRILIDAEIMLVTAVAEVTLTVTRGAEGTTATSHADGATVTHILTAGAIAKLKSELGVTLGLYADRPDPGTAGRVYRCTDFPYEYVDDGLNWIQYAFGQEMPAPSAFNGYTPTQVLPPGANFTQTPFADSFQYATTDNNPSHVGCWFKGSLEGDTWAVTAIFSMNGYFTEQVHTDFDGESNSLTSAGAAVFPAAGIVIADNSFVPSGEDPHIHAINGVAICSFDSNVGAFGLSAGAWFDAVSRNMFQDTAAFWTYTQGLIYLRVRYNAENVDFAYYYYDWSADGINWLNYLRTPAYRLANPTRYGFCLQPWGTPVSATLHALWLGDFTDVVQPTNEPPA